jgi:general secretion pathway protein H
MKQMHGAIPPARQRGFTMIELVVVLLIITLSAALVTPSLSRFSKSVELKGAAKKISVILRYYRSEAVHKGAVYQVLFDSEAREVKVQAVESEEATEEEKKGERIVTKSYILPEGIQIKEVEAPSPQFPSDFPAIEFYPNGGSNGGTILLDTQNRKGFRIKVNFLTGTVKIEEV